MTIRLVDIVKEYPGTTALSGVSVDFRPGEVHAIVGENGAGKTTLVSILSGANRPTRGHIEIDGTARSFDGPRAALDAGIGYVSQEGTLVPFLSGAENIMLGAEPGRLGVIDRRRVLADAVSAAAHFFPDRDLDLQSPVEDLDYAERKVIEIVRALRAAATVLILDEPTASLPAADKEMLVRAIGELKARGLVIILISHFLKEVLALSDRVTVLRDGRKVETSDAGGLDEAHLVQRMLGATAQAFQERHRAPVPPGEARLAVRGLSGAGFRDVDFEVRPGEIVGLIGLSEAGQIAFAEALFGAGGRTTGTIAVDGRTVRIDDPREARRLGIGLVPDQRMAKALVAEYSIGENLAVVNLPSTGMGGLPIVAGARERTNGAAVFAQLRIKANGLEQAVGELSGGNKQKVSIGRWLYGVDARAAYRVLIFVEPTEGVDVGVKAEIHDIILKLADAGVAIVVVSSDLLEISHLCDRVSVFCDGTTTAALGRDRFHEDAFVAAMAGRATGRMG
ncbi:sugar ABC transporter ATP-binding protein [Chthonobacter albigriseus]|uniref:sugar ABC transporter ATP-binding protein n=1 Tax=Chthonobacter albigriseus TaxID=1683161 RepID=UPI0015EF3579|nr:sugar ABC transporter ATP-binding protein [Chthonobacter albigriseus]